MLRLTVSAVALAIASPAFATGFVTPPAPPAIVPVEQDWTGAYIGVQIEGFDRFDSFQFDNAVDGYEGTFSGLFAGYRFDLGDIVIGAEVDYVTGSLDRTFVAPGVIIIGPGDIDVEITRIGGEIGYDLGDILIYGTAGTAQLQLTNFAASFEGSGMFYGFGVDYRVSDRVMVGAEVLQNTFDDFEVAPGLEYEVTTFGLNVAFTF